MTKCVPVIDLFAGAGGLSVGATEAGCDVRASIELDHIACDTLRSNPRFHGEVIKNDVRNVTGSDLRRAASLQTHDPLIIVGGAPCQPFSKAAYWVEDGDEARYRRLRAAGVDAQRPVAPTEARPDERRTGPSAAWFSLQERRYRRR